MADYNFSNFFSRLGKRIVAELIERMNRQVGVDNQSYAALKPETIKQKTKAGAPTSSARMIFTRDFIGKAFQSSSDPSSTTIFINPGLHGRMIRSMGRTLKKYRSQHEYGKASKQTEKINKLTGKTERGNFRTPTYQELSTYQNIPGKSVFFPQSIDQVNNLQAVQTALPEFKGEVIEQTRAMFPELCRMRTINI